MSDYKRVQVSGAPGYADFEGDLIMEVPTFDGRMMSVVGWDRDDPNGFDLFYSHHVKEVSE